VCVFAGGLKGNCLLVPIGKYLLQPKIPSQLSIHSIIIIAFHQLPIDYFYYLVAATFQQITNLHITSFKEKKLNQYENYGWKSSKVYYPLDKKDLVLTTILFSLVFSSPSKLMSQKV
jgi:hypothetical protein